MKRIKIDPESATLIGFHGRKPVYSPDDSKHIFVCGTTGSGKTVALSNYIKRAVDKDYGLLLVDGKGDLSEGSILAIVKQFTRGTNKKVYIVNMTDYDSSCKYNPFRNASVTSIKDMLINMTEWTEPHYKLNAERYLQRVVTLMNMLKISFSFKSIIKHMSEEKFTLMSAELLKQKLISKDDHLENIEIVKISGRIAESCVARFSVIAESELGTIFDESGIDIFEAMREKAIILFILNPLLYPEISPLIGKMILIDSKTCVSKLFSFPMPRTFFMFDEVNSYVSSTLIDIVNKSRSANITCILATQSLSDLSSAEDENFLQQVIENCNNYIVLRQNSAVNAEALAKILGTRETLEMTYQMQQKALNTSETGFGSARRVREFLYHPDTIKSFSVGQGVYMSRDYNTHAKITVNKPF